jgi:hypothetical protein
MGAADSCFEAAYFLEAASIEFCLRMGGGASGFSPGGGMRPKVPLPCLME